MPKSKINFVRGYDSDPERTIDTQSIGSICFTKFKPNEKSIIKQSTTKSVISQSSRIIRKSDETKFYETADIFKPYKEEKKE